MCRGRPAILWVAIVALGLISLGQIGAGFQRAPAVFLVSAVLNVILLIGLYLGHRWAYVLTLLFCVAGAVSGFAAKSSTGLLILAINGLVVAMPVILSSAYFWERPKSGELPDPLRCPKCGYSLLGLTTPRCPECGQEFKMPR